MNIHEVEVYLVIRLKEWNKDIFSVVVQDHVLL